MAAQAPVDLQIADYHLVRAVGQGGMAQVWLARRAVMADATKACALKVPLRHLASDERFVRMFLSEARVAMRLSHSNIVSTFDAGADGELLYLAMEWIDGVDLAKLQQTMRDASVTWSVSVAAHVIGEILQALSYAHSFAVGGTPQGIVHRDVSPHNVLISASGEVKITDFGIARMRGEDTSHEHAKGKLRYMAAEQLGGKATARSDLFAVGAIFHELLEGRKFREGLRGDAFFGAILAGDTPELERPDVPEVLDRLRRGLLAPNQDDRIGSADEALALLAQWPGYRSQRVALRKAVQRHFGGDRRTSGLTGMVPWTADMAQTLQIVERQRGQAPAPAASTISSVDTQPHRAASLPMQPEVTASVDPLPMPRPEPTAFVRPAFVDREAPTNTATPMASDPTWTARPRPRRTRAWLTGGLVLGTLFGAAIAGVLWWVTAPAVSTGPTGPTDVVVAATQDPTQGRPEPAAAIHRRVDAEPDEADAPATNEQRAPRGIAAPRGAGTAAPGQSDTHPDSSTAPEASPPAVLQQSHAVGDGAPAASQHTAPEASAPGSKPTTAKPKPPRVDVVVVLDFVDEAEVAVGRTRRVVRGSVQLSARSGRQRIAWRAPGSRTWVATQRVDLRAGQDHLIRIRPTSIRHEAVGTRKGSG